MLRESPQTLVPDATQRNQTNFTITNAQSSALDFMAKARAASDHY